MALPFRQPVSQSDDNNQSTKPPDLDEQGNPEVTLSITRQAKPPDLDDNGKPVSNKPPDIPASTPAATTTQPSLLSKIWSDISTPLTKAPSELGDYLANQITTPSLDESKLGAELKGFAGGALQGIGNLATQATAPINLLPMLLSGGESLAGESAIGPTLTLARRASSLPTALHGAADIASPNSTIPQRLTGVGELAGGLLGMRGSNVPSPETISKPNIPTPEDLTTPAPVPVPDLNTSIPTGPDLNAIRARINAIQKNVDAKGSASPETNQLLDSLKNQLPEFQNREGKPTAIYIKTQDPATIKQVMQAGYTLDTNDPIRDSDGAYRYIPSNKPINLPTAPEPSLSSPVPNEARGTNQSIPTPQEGLTQLRKINDQAKMANPEQKKGLYREASDFIRTMLTSFSFLAPGRHGVGLITHPEYWGAFDDMFKSWGSELGNKAVQDAIQYDPSGYARPQVKSDGTLGPSLIEQAGLKMYGPQGDPSAGIYRSKYAEMIPGVKRNIRAYGAFLNTANFNIFKKLYGQAEAEGKASPYLAKQIANAINISSGYGNLGDIAKSETAMKILNETLFAPHMQASRMQIIGRVLDPRTYTSTDPIVRKEALRSLLGIVGTALVANGLGHALGGTITDNPTSSDFGKVKVGNTHLDFLQGLGQYGVAAAKLITHQSTSTTTGKVSDLTSGKYGAQTRKDVVENFLASKLAPIPSFIYDWMRGKEFDGTPFEVKKELATKVAPIVMQDLYSICQNDPSLLPLSIFPMFGFSAQSYGR